jgi:hypothetical protein
MNFWQKLQLAGALSTLVVAVLVVCTALLLEPDGNQAPPAPLRPQPTIGLERPGNNGL